MPKKRHRQIVAALDDALMKKLRRSRALIAKELPELVAKDQRLHDAMRDALRAARCGERSIRARFSCLTLRSAAETDLGTLDAFLTAERPLTSDIIDRLAKILKLKLEAIGSRPRPSAVQGRMNVLADSVRFDESEPHRHPDGQPATRKPFISFHCSGVYSTSRALLPL